MSDAERGSKSRLARELGVSRSGLYYRRKIPEKDEELRTAIELVMREHPGYGYRRVAIVLKINHKRISRVMRKYGLKPARRAKSPMNVLDRGREPAQYPDILSIFCPIEPDFVWVSDFTFISYNGEFIYLCTVLDVFTWEPLGFSISRRHDAEFVRLAIERAIVRVGRCPSWFHSDQGSEYLAQEVCEWLEALSVAISMSPKSSPWRNGSQESFFGRFKVEFGDPERFATLPDLIEALYEHLHYFCNVRIKNRLKMSPAQFRRNWLDQQRMLTKSSPLVAPGCELERGVSTLATPRSDLNSHIHNFTGLSTSYESPPSTPLNPLQAIDGNQLRPYPLPRTTTT